MNEHKIEDFLPHMQDLVDLHYQIRRFTEANGQNSRPGSEADKELSEFPRPDLVKDAYHMGILASESATEHMMGFTSVMVFPLMAVVPWTVVIDLQESKV